MGRNDNYFFIVFAVLCVFVVGFMVASASKKKSTSTSSKPKKPATGTCSAHTCSGIDNVNDPAYNMKNVIMQTILLEEHLAEDRKYCKSCICKHFLHICGLNDEAIWMAGPNVKKYPYLEEAEGLYTRLFDKWRAQMDDKKVRLEVLEEMRAFRQKLIVAYYLNE